MTTYYKKHWENFLNERTTELQEEIKTLRSENARYREALEFIKCENKKTEVSFNDQARYWRDQECQSRSRAFYALEDLK